jgi:hypothetical protein
VKILFYVLALAVTAFAILSLAQGIRAYLAGEGFQITLFGTAIVGILLAGIWFKRAKSMH